jgi:spore maturation protein CgeB
VRIFLAIPRSPNPTFVSDLWARNLHDPLVALGHDVVLFDDGLLPLFDLDPAAVATAVPRDEFGARLLRAVEAADRAGRLDLILTYVGDSHVTPEVIRRLRERTAPVVNFYCNNIHQFHLIRRTAPHFTACLVPEEEALGSYRRVGANAVFFPMAANPGVYRPLPLPARYDATFAGQRYGDRTTGLLALREGGVDAHAFGQGWDAEAPASSAARPGRLRRSLQLLLQGRSPLAAAADLRAIGTLRTRHAAALHPPATDDGYIALFSECRISLGFIVLGDTHSTFRPLRQVRLREFEAPMAGAFYMTGFLEELSLHYEIGREIVCYRSREELVDRCRYFLAHDEERERIRKAGHERARRDHTWERRFTDLFAALRRGGVLSP